MRFLLEGHKEMDSTDWLVCALVRRIWSFLPTICSKQLVQANNMLLSVSLNYSWWKKSCTTRVVFKTLYIMGLTTNLNWWVYRISEPSTVWSSFVSMWELDLGAARTVAGCNLLLTPLHSTCGKSRRRSFGEVLQSTKRMLNQLSSKANHWNIATNILKSLPHFPHMNHSQRSVTRNTIEIKQHPEPTVGPRHTAIRNRVFSGKSICSRVGKPPNSRERSFSCAGW